MGEEEDPNLEESAACEGVFSQFALSVFRGS
jgi:hypothetical protein